MMKPKQIMEVHSEDKVVYDLLGFLNKKPVMQIKKTDVSNPPQHSDSKQLLNTTNKAIGKFVILKNQHIKKVCTPNAAINLKNITKVPASSILKINEVVAWSKLVTKIDANQVVTQTDKKLLRTYSKKQDKTYLRSANDDNAVVDKTAHIGTLPDSNSKNFDVGVSLIRSGQRNLSNVDINNHIQSSNFVEGSTENKDAIVCESGENKDYIKIEEYSVTGDVPTKLETLEESNENMGKIKHFKEKTQQETANNESIGKQMFETNPAASDTESTSSNLQNRPKKRTKTKPNKRQLIRREIEKCLKQQSMKRSRKRRILEGRQKSISCQTVEECKKETNEISTQTEDGNNSNNTENNTENTDENMDLLQLHDYIENMSVIAQDVNFGTGPVMPGVFRGKNLSSGVGNTPVYSNAAFTDYFGQFGATTLPRSMCLDFVTTTNGAGGDVDSRKVMFYNYLKKCDQTDAGGNIPLHIAVMASDIAEVRRQCHVLSLRSKPVDVPNISGLTPLHVAVVNGCPVELIQVLLENGADPLAMDNDGNTSLHLAVSCHSKAVLVHLLKYVQDSGQMVDVFNYEGFTPLMLSVLEDEYDLVHECVNYGADPNTKDQKSGRTSLFHAVENNNESMVKLFIIQGANTKIKNFFGTSTHEATFELENIKPEIKNLVVGRDSCPSRGVNRDRAKKKKTPSAEKFPDMKNKLKTVRVLKVIKVNKPLGV